MATIRKEQNNISKIKDSQGNWFEGQELAAYPKSSKRDLKLV